MRRLDEVLAGLPERPSPEELAEVLGVQQQTVWRWLRRGVIPGRKLSGTWVVFRDEVRDSLAVQLDAQAAARSAAQLQAPVQEGVDSVDGLDEPDLTLGGAPT
ncbi:helix-turn-helix domain-containing protein [Kineococcus indalonis]|uniref:helix-turn-helix domain-containing protein n=1 Tax=Kineococcus indalonis TaxID=2696566 RepID=UPI001412FA7C|nr:helix-turn-helix domain-containing protein [Kineococcus indalonis]NAZ84564.1 helix-turn-helix domain-containing protein [Kineococcus indalonis]